VAQIWIGADKYDLSGPSNEQCQLRIAYNEKNVVTAMHVNNSEHWPLLADLAYECIATNNYSAEVAMLIQSFRSRLDRIGWKLVSASETPYRMTTTVIGNPDERIEIEINFDKQGLVSSVRPLAASNTETLEIIRSALQ
jgi:hypothetical protein